MAILSNFRNDGARQTHEDHANVFGNA